MEQIVSNWLQSHQAYAIWLVPAFAFLESCLGIGIFVSGAFLVLVASLVLANELASIELIVVLGFCGAVVGDQVGFHIGRWLGPRFHHLALVERHRGKINKAEDLIRGRGAVAIFVGRFVPAIRSLIPAMLGISGFRPWRYSLLDMCACAVWALALGLIVSGTGQLL